jgi:hypothetical protein
MSSTTTDKDTKPEHQDGAYSGLPNKTVRAANGIDYAYRDTGEKALLRHFHGSTGTTPDTVEQMARDARHGRRAKRSTTPSARGASAITRCCRGSAARRCRAFLSD